MAVNLSPVGGVAAQFFTNTGAVLTGGKLYTYLAGTTTPATTFTSSNGATPWSNPIVLDAAGRVPNSGEIWLTDGISYKFVLKDSNDVLIATYDNITGINSNALAFTSQQQIITATAGQTVFNLSISYLPGTNSLSVFVDGVNQYGPGAQYAYTETDSDTVTFVSGLHVGAQVKFTTTQQQSAGAVDAEQVSYQPPFTNAVATNVEAKLAQTVSVLDFGAVGDGIVNDWEACQKACDYVQSIGGGTVLFPAGKIYRIAGNTIIIWGNNVNLIGYGATLYKDNAGGSAGYYGDALTVFGKVNGYLYYSPQVAGGTYTSPATYTGTTVASVNINIEGFRVTFGTHSTDTINGISGLNFAHVTVKNCVVVSSPQTSFAWVATENTSCLHLTMDNCFSDGSGMQAFRFNSYNTNPNDAGEMFAKVINCRSENTQLTVVSPWAEQYGLPSSAFVRASSNNIQFQVSFDNCQFDATTHLLDGYRTTSFRNCRLGFVFALNASPACVLMFDNCRFRDFDVATGTGGIYSQFFARNTSNSKAVIDIKACTFDTPAAADYSIYSRGFDVNVVDCTGEMTVYAIDWTTEISSVRIENCTLKNPGSAPLSFAAENVSVLACEVYTPLNIIQSGAKAVSVQDNKFFVDNTFSTFCVVVTNGSVTAINNIVDYTNNSYATVLIAPLANTLLKTNQYLYASGAEISYDQSYANATPTTGYWQATSRIIRAQQTVGSPKAWVCTVAGAPGTWVSEGNL